MRTTHSKLPTADRPADATADTQARLVQAAYDTFVERGYHDATLQDISKRANLTTGAVYSRFSGKEALFLAAFSRRSSEQRRVWETYMSRAAFLGGEQNSFARVLLTVLPDPGIYRALQEFTSSALTPDSKAVLIRTRDEWFELLERLLDIHCRLIGVTPAQPLAALVRPVAAVIDGISGMVVLDPTVDAEQIFLSTLDLLLAPECAASGTH